MFDSAPRIHFPKNLVDRMEQLARSLPPESRVGQLALILVAASEGFPNYGVARALLLNRSTVQRWRLKLAMSDDPEALIRAMGVSGRPPVISLSVKEAVAATARSHPEMSTRELGRRFGMSHVHVHRILKKAKERNVTEPASHEKKPSRGLGQVR